jgi:sugar phosphate isomerase/epimerase
MREIHDLKIDGAVSVELEFAPDPDRIVEWVREAYEGTASLMRASGLRS